MDKTFGEKVLDAIYIDRPGAYLICIKDDLVLTVKNHKGYFLLGGGIEQGEDHEQCLRREALEEVGFSIEIVNYLYAADTYCIHERIGYFHPIQYYYEGKLISKVQEPIETDHEIVWLPFDEIDEKMYVGQQIWAVKEYMTKLKNELK